MNIPIIDIGLLNKENHKLAKEIREACSQTGFFYIKNHSVSEKLQSDLATISEQFFKLPLEDKNQINMRKAGKAWRGYFPVKGELTSNIPDVKEGIYFGEEHEKQSKEVLNGIPLFGSNLYPHQVPEFKNVIAQYMLAMKKLADKVMQAIALSLGLEMDYFIKHYTYNPTQLFRIFHYPPTKQKEEDELWGVGAHTDYGLITILKQDQVGGLQVKGKKNDWIDAPPIKNTFVCNIGDMLDYLTAGFYQSTLHRVKNTTTKSRYSFPYFFDPSFNAEIKQIELSHLCIGKFERNTRWDNADLHAFKGTYGQYILNKIGKVFPGL
ncbi:MAG: isopenicillin N synthase family oxygenase [Bacteroidetes bacterium]|nr:isopenicillin N synthase family oxygenase [Bacteroidota bacterium]